MCISNPIQFNLIFISVLNIVSGDGIITLDPYIRHPVFTDNFLSTGSTMHTHCQLNLEFSLLPPNFQNWILVCQHDFVDS